MGNRNSILYSYLIYCYNFFLGGGGIFLMLFLFCLPVSCSEMRFTVRNSLGASIFRRMDLATILQVFRLLGETFTDLGDILPTAECSSFIVLLLIVKDISGISWNTEDKFGVNLCLKKAVMLGDHSFWDASKSTVRGLFSPCIFS